MKVVKLRIINFRTFKDSKMYFDENENYFVGKNNVGKTSILELLDTLFNHNMFKGEDFFDPNESIDVYAKFILSDEELGIFDDLISEDGSSISIVFHQDSPDSLIEASHLETSTIISRSRLKRINYLTYSSNRKTFKDGDLTSFSKSYQLIPRLVKYYISQNSPDKLIQSDYESNLINFINNSLSNIGTFNQNNLSVKALNTSEDFFTKTMVLSDDDGIPFNKLGFGTQFFSIIPMVIIDKIFNILKFSPEDKIIQYDNGNKGLNLMIGIDEPEIHLHPNMQQQLINYIKSIMSGKNVGFNSILKILFGIDFLSGQIFIVTHSPSVLSSDYKKILHFKKARGGSTKVVSGKCINFNEKVNKQLYQQLIYFKRSLFSDSVIICEGPTEQRALIEFANSINIKLIDNNVDIIVGDGVQNVPILYELFDKIGIKPVGIIDNDNGSNDKIINKYRNIFLTENNDFEYECYSVMSIEEIFEYMFEYLKNIGEEEYDEHTIVSMMLRFFYNFDVKYDYHYQDMIKKEMTFKNVINVLKEMDDVQKENLKHQMKKPLMTKKKYFKNKSIINGTIIAHNVSNVPKSYKKAIMEAVKNE